MKLYSFVGSHDVSIYIDAIYDPSTRKYRGGKCAAVIPYAGRMLSAQLAKSVESTLDVNGVELPLRSKMEWESVDPIPDDCDYAIVSVQYVSACQSLGLDTSRLLTCGPAVVDDAGRIVGSAWLNRN